MNRIACAFACKAVVALFTVGCGSSTSASGVGSDFPTNPSDLGPDASDWRKETAEPGPSGSGSGFGENSRLIAAGHDFTCAIESATGTVRCWGQLECGDSAPVVIDGLANATAVSASAGGEHACALDAAGAIACWGENEYGQLGDGGDDGSETPVAVAGLSGVTSIAAGAWHTCAVSGGVVKCWGDNRAGALGGDPDVLESSATAIDVAGVPASMTVAAGGGHACALAVDGSVFCWGANDRGQLGRAASNTPGAPEMIAGLSGVVGLVTGEKHTCAATATDVLCWGANGLGQLGVGTSTDTATPTKATGAAAELSAGFDTGCAVQSGGAKCWGNNDGGQVGSGSEDDRVLAPVDVSGLTSGVLAVASGRDHACALLDGGAIACWGENDHGQLGNDDHGSRVPVPVSF